ncbi:uncharacterized protein VTP21DRAFT_377 [Calcarisporiella thermophila]|uniref:uncharacterized protein n=1 Tax=Calcarisporiella thermophila TaxID=911321 RepID=UPI0037430479
MQTAGAEDKVEMNILMEQSSTLDTEGSNTSTAVPSASIMAADGQGKITFSQPTLPDRSRTLTRSDPRGLPQSTPEEHAAIRAKFNKSKKKGKKEIEQVNIDEHLLSPEDCAKRYSTSINPTKPAESRGLDPYHATRLLKENGPNQLTPPKKKHAIVKYLECLSTLFNLLLIVAGVIEYILYGIDPVGNFPNTYLGAILIVVAFLNAFIEFYQMQKSAAILESFLNMIPATCRCIREGKLLQMPASNLVLGDVVFLRMGDKVPADVFLFSCSEMKVDNSSLTGESEPQERSVTNTHKNPLEATNMLFNGTLIVAGEGYGIVVRTGDRTVLGQIAGLTAGEDKRKSPLSQEIDNFVKIIASIAIVTAAIFFGIGFRVNNGNIGLTLNFAIGVLVAWVPQGLPATVTMLLTIAAKRMAQRNVLVKDLQGVETLGAITLLATDKTGTLTRNQMTVTNIWTGLRMMTVHRSLNQEEELATSGTPGVSEIMHISSLCTRAKFDRTDVPIDQREVLGDATEAGLLRYAAQNLSEFEKAQELYPKVFEIPFNSDNKWHMSIHKMPHSTGDLTLFIKGAPERVLRLCDTILDNGIVPLTDRHREQFQNAYEYMASKGHRVLAFAQLLMPREQYPSDFEFSKEKKNYPTSGLTFVGLTSLEDPPKHGVREAIGRCRSAGIKVMMVTGDHPLTAEAIGRKINLVLSDTREMVAKRTGRQVDDVGEDEYDAIVIHGEMIDALTDQEWDRIFSKTEIIFARTSPRHKLEIVKRAQSMGHIVGVTGDGVNDSPALKKADLGIAMNQSGSDVSKEAAAMILLDDNFASTVHGIEEGRLIFTNLKKSIRYTISHSTPEVVPQLLYVVAPIPLGISAILILVIDLGFELFLALSFAWDKPETKSGLMKLQPRKPVTSRSIERLRRIALRRLPTRIDEETGEAVHPGRVATMAHRVKRVFTLDFWRENLIDSTGAELLVDGDLLLWAYLEAGIMETIASMLSFFVVLNYHGISPYDCRQMALEGSYFRDDSPNYTTASGRVLTYLEQKDALAQGQSILYLSIMIMQAFNMFACKARLRLPFGKFMFSNPYNFAGLAGGAVLAMAIVYIPPFNIPFGTSWRLSPMFWLIPIAFGFLLIAYTTFRIWIIRKTRPIRFNPEIDNLQMHPTTYTVKAG